MKTANVAFRRTAHRAPRSTKPRTHRLPICGSTELVRYRDRHQARDGVRAIVASAGYRASTFACPDCRGFHIDLAKSSEASIDSPTALPDEPFETSLASRKHRYFLIDIENPTCGAKASPEEVGNLWRLLQEQAPGATRHDHVVVGAARSVAARYRASITGDNVKWVVGANAKDGADRALLAAVDIHAVARNYEELVIVSGDHAFTDLARRAKGLGITVHVITAEKPDGRSMLSRELSEAADLHTVIRRRARSQEARAVHAVHAMSAAWRNNNHAA